MNNSLAEVHPELISEWSEKNLTLTPDDITFGSNKKVWWRSACGHEWQASVKARSNGEKCPICSGARVIAGINDLATLEPLLVKQWSKKNKIKPTEVSIGSHKKVIWRCEKGHEWEAAVKSRTINKTACPYCSNNKVLAGFNDLATFLPDIAAEWSDRNYPTLPTQVTVFVNRKVWWKCKDCGREWNTLISTRSGGSKCPYCSGYIFLKGFNDLQTTHPEIALEWSEKNLPLKLDTIGKNIRKFRLARKLRQEDLAEKTDLTTNYIGMVERGEKIPSLETFIKILNALGVSSDMVLTDVLETGYTVKNSMLNEKLEKLAPEDRNRIYEVIDTLVKQSKQILP